MGRVGFACALQNYSGDSFRPRWKNICLLSNYAEAGQADAYKPPLYHMEDSEFTALGVPMVMFDRFETLPYWTRFLGCSRKGKIQNDEMYRKRYI